MRDEMDGFLKCHAWVCVIAWKSVFKKRGGTSDKAKEQLLTEETEGVVIKCSSSLRCTVDI